MIVGTQFCVEETREVKSKWAVYMVPLTLTLNETFVKVHAGITYFRVLTLKRA